VANTFSGVCRVTVVAPAGRADVAVPDDLPLIELLPMFLDNRVAGSVQAQGWTFQRFGDPVLDDERSPAELGLHDGDVLYLRPAADPLPSIDFDDIVDGVNTTAQELPGRWEPAYGRRLQLGAAGVAMLAGLFGGLAGGPAGPRAVACGVLALLLLIGAAAFSRALGDRTAATLLGTAGVLFAGVAGALLPSLATASAPAGGVVLSGASLAAAATVVASVAVGAGSPLFAGLLSVAVAAVLGGLLTVWPGLSGVGAAAAVLALTYLLSVWSPNLAARLVRLRVPALPSGRADLPRDIEPHPEHLVRAQTEAADRFLGATGGAVALICSGCFGLLLMRPGPAEVALVAVVCAGLLLRARSMAATWQRLAATLPALAGSAALLIAAAVHGGATTRIVLTGVGAGIGSVLMWIAVQRRPDRESPYWGRLADVAETVTAVAVVPVAVAAMGGYAFARGLVG
jgi:type VII secretion integral membrane protein EccD